MNRRRADGSASVDSLLAAGGLDRGLLGLRRRCTGVGPDLATVVAAERRRSHGGRHRGPPAARRRCPRARRHRATSEREGRRCRGAGRRVRGGRRGRAADPPRPTFGLPCSGSRVGRRMRRGPAGVAADLGADWSDVHARLDHGETTSVGPRRSAVHHRRSRRTAALRPERCCGGRRIRRVAGAAAEAEARVADLAARIRGATRAEPLPSAQRDAAGWRAFYELVDVAAGADRRRRAGGRPGGIRDARRLGVRRRRGRAPRAPTTSSSPPRSPPTTAPRRSPACSARRSRRTARCTGTVVALLAAIGWASRRSGPRGWPTTVAGRPLGAARAWSKTAVEFLGAGARRETRRRQLERACRAGCAARARIGAGCGGGSGAQRDLIEALPTTMPSHALIDDIAATCSLRSGRWRWLPAVTTQTDGHPSRRGRRPTGSQSPWPIAPPPTACP